MQIENTYTSEAQAVRQFMARRGYVRTSSSPCCCMGRMMSETSNKPHSVSFDKIINGNKVSIIDILYRKFGATLSYASDVIKNSKNKDTIKIDFPKESIDKLVLLCKILEKEGIPYTKEESIDIYEPACPCEMKMYERVNGEYFKIEESIFDCGIRFTAKKV